MQSWRSIREALGNRPGSGSYLVSDEGEDPQVARPVIIFPDIEAMQLQYLENTLAEYVYMYLVCQPWTESVSGQSAGERAANQQNAACNARTGAERAAPAAGAGAEH